MNGTDFESGNDGRLDIAVGIVVDSEDDDDLGTVRVRYTWRGSERETEQIRVAVPLAGADYGTYFLPEPGDEVLLAFDDGNINFPYVIGSLWNVDSEPPVETDERLDVTRIRSRSGHEITFDDAESNERIEIVTKGGHRIVLDDASGEERVTIEDSAGQGIVLDTASDNVEITSNGTLKLSAATVEIEGTTEVTVESPREVSISGKPIQLNKPP